MRYAILGTTQALRPDGTASAPPGGRLRALLTALALRPGRVVGAETLIDEVWDGDPPAGATGALQALVGRLRRTLGHDAVRSVDGGYLLNAARDDVDLYRFERLAEEGARALADGDPVKASGLLGDALALWRGPALADLPDRATAAVRVEALRVDALRQRLTAELALGRADRILPELAELAAAHPLDEPLRALHIRALRAAGRTADALAAYEAVRRDLADQLGTDPSVELRRLHAELLTPDPLPEPAAAPAAPAAPAAARPTVPAPAAVPVPEQSAPPRAVGNSRARLTSFVGREGDLVAVGNDLARARLVTLTGPGGTGKTRLSQEAGDRLADRWPDGVWYAELAPVSDPGTLPEAVISALGLRETHLRGGSAAETAMVADGKNKDAARQLADYCAGRTLLLVLDNCEHVIDAAAALAERLLAECPGLSVLATSREPLGVPGESVRPLDPLPDPTALRLLADRGAAARPGFSVEDDPEACAELCHRLDGLPLAIELAAARLRSMSPRQLADRLDDRFRLLTGGSRTLLPRQQTLRAVVDWSWDLMEPMERVLLRRLAVFRGGCTLEAAEVVCADPDPDPEIGAAGRGGGPGGDRIDGGDVAALLGSLVDKSLILADVTPDGARYRMLETISEYAGERLDASGERAAVEARHIVFFREFARCADRRLRGRDQLVWFERLEREHENLRAALRRVVDAGDEQQALLLVLSCTWFWEVRNYRSERRQWPAAVAAMGPDPFDEEPTLEPVPVGALEAPPPLEGGRLTEARRWARVIELTADDTENEWWNNPGLARVGKGLIAAYPPHLPQSARFPGIMRPYGAFFSGDFERLPGLVDETVEACRRHGRDWELAYSLQLRAKVNNDVLERAHTAVEDVGESRRLFERLGDDWGVAETLSAEAEAAGSRGDYQRAAECCRQGVELARRIGSQQHVPVLTVRLGEALVNAGERDEGLRLLYEGVAEAEKFGAMNDGAAFYGKMLLTMALAREGQNAEALALVEETMQGDVLRGQPNFIAGILSGVKGYLIGRLGRPEEGLRMLGDGIAVLAGHALANVITPRLGVLLAPGAIELLAILAEDGSRGTGRLDDLAGRRARRAVMLACAHERLRPQVIPPAEAKLLAEVVDRLRALLGEDAFASAYAEGDGLSVDETVALMRDVD